MSQCDFCTELSAKTGVIHGYIKGESGEDDKAVFLSVKACTYHVERPDFFPDKPTPLEEIKPPMWKTFVQQGKQDDFGYQALVHMGNARHMMSWANNALEDRQGIPASIVRDMLDVTQKIGDIQESLRKWTGGSEK